MENFTVNLGEENINVSLNEVVVLSNEVVSSELTEVMTRTGKNTDDDAVQFDAEIHVGSPTNPKEMVVGEGDSYPVPMAFHVDLANISGSTITGAIDVSSGLQSDTGSAIPLFNGNTSGKILLVASDYTFGGAKVKMDTLGTVEPDNVAIEYLRDTSNWIEAPFMVTDSKFPLTQKGQRIASCGSCSEQWRIGFNPDELPTVWEKVTLNINGIDYTKYWGRFIIKSDITSDPQVEQMKLHTNRWECNEDGTTEYFGRARFPRTLIAGMQNVTANKSLDPKETEVFYSSNVSAKYRENKFEFDKNNGFLLVQNIEDGMDTSIPLELSVSWYVEGTGTGNVNMHLDIFDVADGYSYDGTNIPRSFENTINEVNVDSNLIRQTTNIKFPVNKLTTEDGILIHLHRDSTVANPLDTLPHNIIITNIKLVGYFWRP